MYTNILGLFCGFHLGKYYPKVECQPEVPHGGWPQHNPLRRSASVFRGVDVFRFLMGVVFLCKHPKEYVIWVVATEICFFCYPLFGEMIPILTHIFQMG